jgi:hypothetical protein
MVVGMLSFTQCASFANRLAFREFALTDGRLIPSITTVL